MPTDWYFRVDVTCSRLQKSVEFATAVRELVSQDDPTEDWIQEEIRQDLDGAKLY